MAVFFRNDQWTQDAQGNAISGAATYVCSQPATTTSIPPSPLVPLYEDPAGVIPITNPVISDGYGHSFFYVASGTYTLLTTSPQIQTVILPDQIISGVISPITSSPLSGAINGTNRVFTLLSTPSNFSMIYLNGVLQLPGTNYTISGPTVTFNNAPETGDMLWSVYQ
jgi:hypothetical protein